MYQYTATISYTGANIFVQFLWARITRNAGSMTLSIVTDPTTIQNLRNAGTAAGFVFSNISRIPVPTPEIVP